MMNNKKKKCNAHKYVNLLFVPSNPITSDYLLQITCFHTPRETSKRPVCDVIRMTELREVQS